MIELIGDGIEVAVDPARGAEIVRVARPGGKNMLFHNPTATPLRASRSVSYGSSTHDWLSEYRGGWQELFPNAGDECTVDGIPLPLHGEASSAAWGVRRQNTRDVVFWTPTRLPLVLERRMIVDKERPVLRIVETVVNESASSASFLWGHHPAFDARDGALIDLPPSRVSGR